MIDIILILILLVLILFSSIYIYRQKKKGNKCIGCPHCSTCSKKPSRFS